MYVEISLAVIAKRPYPSLGVIPCDPRRGRIKAVTDRDVCASIDLPSGLRLAEGSIAVGGVPLAGTRARVNTPGDPAGNAPATQVAGPAEANRLTDS